MKTYNTKTIYINAESQLLTDSQGFNPPTVEFHYNSCYSIRFILRDNNNIPIDLTGFTFKMGIDYSFIAGNIDLILSDNSQFNISGDWNETNTAEGKITCRTDLRQQRILDYILADPYKIAYVDLVAMKEGEPNYLLAQFKTNIKNVIYIIDEDAESSSSSSIDSSSSSSSSSLEYSSSSSSSSSLEYSSSSSSELYSESSESSSLSSDSSDSSESSLSSDTARTCKLALPA